MTDTYNAAAADLAKLEAEILSSRSVLATANEDKIRAAEVHEKRQKRDE